jgi:hypothetical protein
MNTRRRASQASSQATRSGSENYSSATVANDSIPPAPEISSPNQVTPEQTKMAPPRTPSPAKGKTTAVISPKHDAIAARSATSEYLYPNSSLGSSPLSSPPTSLGTTPEGLAGLTTKRTRKAAPLSPTRKTRDKRITTLPVNYGKLSPEQQTDLKRKAGGDDDFVAEDDILDGRARKRAEPSPPVKPALKQSKRPRGRPKKVRFDSQPPDPETTDLLALADVALAGEQRGTNVRTLAEETESVTKRLSSSQDSNEAPAPFTAGKPGRKPGSNPGPKPGRKPKPKKTKAGLDLWDLETNPQRHEEWVNTSVFGHEHEDPNNPVFYAANGVTQWTAPADSSPVKRGRGGGNIGGGVKKRRGGGGWNKGMGKGKGKGKGRGRGRPSRREEEEDPFEGGESAPDDHKTIVKNLKARQGILRGFFREVGRQQADIIDILSLRDLNKLLRRANAHKKVPEYDDITEDLDEKKEDAIDFASHELAIKTRLAESNLAQERKLIQKQYLSRFTQVQQEYLSGAQGDIIQLNKLHATVLDDDRTDDGSHNQEDSSYFPRYHASPLPQQRVRGYTANRITDERPFKSRLAASTYDDLIRREVLQSDIMDPIIRSREASNKARLESEAKEKTQNMMALSNEAITQLGEIKGYLVPTAMSMSEYSSYGLSLLADVSEYHADRFKEKAYRFLRLPAGETFTKEHLEYEQLPGQGGPPRLAHPVFPRNPVIPNPTVKPPPTATGAQTHQFVFQNPGVVPNITTRPTQQAAPVQQRFPVQFVNQTIESRKAAGNGGKGGQRVLLPKV